jgi:hypothetical protein
VLAEAGSLVAGEIADAMIAERRKRLGSPQDAQPISDKMARLVAAARKWREFMFGDRGELNTEDAAKLADGDWEADLLRAIDALGAE